MLALRRQGFGLAWILSVDLAGGASSSSSKLILPPDMVLDPGIGKHFHSTISCLAAAGLANLFICFDLGPCNHIILEAGRDHVYKHRSEHLW